MLRYLVLACLTVFGLAAAEHHGQVTFGGLPLPGATVTATVGEKRLSAITDQQGAYTFPDLPDGTWKIRVEMQCFEPVEREVAVAPNAPAALWELKMLPLTEITANLPAPAPVPAAAPAVAVAAAAPPRKGKAKDSAAAPAQPPQAGFQRTDLKASSDAGKLDESDTGEFKQNATDGLLINGSVNNGAASPFGQAAAFGNFRRGPRSLYTGGIGWIVDHSALDARPFSLTGQDTPKPAFSHVMGVASFGGPLKIPHILPRNGPNVFVNYQWLRNRNATTQPGLMPDAQQRAGVFTGAGDRSPDRRAFPWQRDSRRAASARRRPRCWGCIRRRTSSREAGTTTRSRSWPSLTRTACNRGGIKRPGIPINSPGASRFRACAPTIPASSGSMTRAASWASTRR